MDKAITTNNIMPAPNNSLKLREKRLYHGLKNSILKTVPRRASRGLTNTIKKITTLATW